MRSLLSKFPVVFSLSLLAVSPAGAHVGALDAYGCHSNTALYGNSSKRECHTALLAGQVFSSTTAEYKAYIAAQQAIITDLTAKLTQCQVNCQTVGSLMLTWAANTEGDLAGYRIYCRTASGSATIQRAVGKVTTFRLDNLPGGQTYLCTITAFDTAGNESARSSEVNKTIP